MVGTGVLLGVGSGEGVRVNVGTRVEVAGRTVACSGVVDKLVASVVGDGEAAGNVSAPQAARLKVITGIRIVTIRVEFIGHLNH